MAASDSAKLIKPEQRSPGHHTGGMKREDAISLPGFWAGYARNAAHTSSEWHHHGDNESAIFVVKGTLKLEFGAGGKQTFDALPGDFVHVPKWAIHRELNPEDIETEVVVFRAGEGPLVTNVEGPAAD